MSISDIYPYENIIGGMPLTHKYGPSLIEFTKALAQQLDSFITGTERIQADFSADNALGPVIDSIAKLVDVTRRAGQSDKTLSSIVLDEVATREQTTINALTTAINNIIGTDPTIEEYPEIDFVNDHGLSRNEGAFLVTIVMPDQEQLKDLKRQTDVYKAAGIAAIYNIVTELIFTDEMTVFEELFSIMFTFYYGESMTTLSDSLDRLEIELKLTEALTTITDALKHEGEMFFSEALTTFDDYLSFEGVLYLSDDLTTMSDYLGGGSIEAFHTESLTSITDALRHEGEMFFSESLTTFDDVLLFEGVLFFTEDLTTLDDYLGGGSIEAFYTESLSSIVEQLEFDIKKAFIENLTTIDDDLSFEGILYLTEDLSTITDYFGGGAIDAIPFTDSLPNYPIAIIGEAQLDTHVVGGHWTYTEGDYWDSAIWDIAVWDSTGNVLSIKELF